MDFTKKRLQVFVSSTYTDLQADRQSAVEAILTAGHIPAGMELFTAGDESQMEVIKQWIDESDIYLLILGGRYGSIETKSGKSYTHLEYEYALSRKMPVFACVLSESAIDERVATRGKEVLELENPALLKDFRELVLSKIVRRCEDAKDIKIAVSESLAHLARKPELRGWIRAGDEMNAAAVADEIARLSKENAELKAITPKAEIEERYNGLSFSDFYDLILHNNAEDAIWSIWNIGRFEASKQILRFLKQMDIVEFDPNGQIVLTTVGKKFCARLKSMELKSEPGDQPTSEVVANLASRTDIP